ncbi:unnamed protein product [Urochloa decumbens]|uniref:NB-ARC domain-containing protein n=1 Tax=Urochloa decumbens TaxID=240449 RepID=A0ABC8VDJ9_9POAL
MEVAISTANWLLNKVLHKLSDDLVAGYVASRELGLNFDKTELSYTLGLLHEAQGRGVSHNPGLKVLLEDLSRKADEAEDALDELHYFMIQDELDGTQEATPELGDGLAAQALHARHAARNTAGNWLSCFSVCCHSKDDVAAVTDNTSKDTDTQDDHVDKLPFDRVAMSNKIKQLIEDMLSLCPRISDLLKINTRSSTIPGSFANSVSLERPAIGSTIRQEKLYGRSTIFEQTINRITSGTCSEALEDKWVNLLAPFTTTEAEKGSRVIVTTRFPSIADTVKANNPVNLEGLEPGEFWVFFQACVFGEVIADDPDTQELVNIARQIADRLKCSPLAAKTVGRLLKKRLSRERIPREQWTNILEKKEWLNQTGDDDIMPALKISYDYLPYHLQKCFSYCALFPEDYKFDSLEIGRFWVSVGIIHSSGQNDKIEDIGSEYMDELLDNGFLMKGDDTYYIMHDLMHELAQSVSSKECAYISCPSFRAHDIPLSIRHLSIFMQNDYTETFVEEMDKLRRRIDIRNLRSLMIFGEYRRASLVNLLKDTFKQMKGLRVLFIFMNTLNSLPRNFSKLVHLRYLKLKSPGYSKPPCEFASFYCPQTIPYPEVGKMKFLQQLKRFHVKKESAGFELREVGQLVQLGGKLSICGLENVSSDKEADEARLMAKRDLVKVGLVWSREHQSMVDDILANLQPHSNLRALCIVNHGGATGPSWLCSNIHMKNLETLHLEGVSWSTLPPFGQIHHLRKLKLKNIIGVCQFGPDFIGGTTEKSFTHLKEVQFHDMPELVEWVGGANTHLFSRLERIRCSNCPKLAALPFPTCSSSSTQDNIIWFPNLCYLFTGQCPKLSLPPLPHTRMLSSFQTDSLRYGSRHLSINKMPGELAFHNLCEVESLMVRDALHISFTDLQKIHSLRTILVQRCGDAFLRGLDDDIVLYSVQYLSLRKFPLTRKSLSNLFKYFPAVSHLDNFTMDGFNPLVTSNLQHLEAYNSRGDGADPYSIAADLLAEVARTKTIPAGSFQLVELEVDSISAVLVAPICTRLSATLRKLWFQNDWRAESFMEEQEQALQLLTSLQFLSFVRCRALLSLPQGLHCLSSLETLYINRSPRIGSLPKTGLPDSLQDLFIIDCRADLYEECQKLRGIRPDIHVTARLLSRQTEED